MRRSGKTAWRALVLAATVSMAGFGVAAAEQWVSDDGRVQVTVPDGWPVDVMSDPGDTVLEVAAGTADQECRLYAIPNTGTSAATTAQIVRAFTQPLTAEQWSAVISGIPLTRGGEVTAVNLDQSGFWPRQEAQIAKEGGVIYASLQGRPGYDIYTFCKTYGGADAPELYNSLMDSVGASGDAAAQAAAEAAAAATPAPAPQ